jgi:large subunit ribosomal protein L10
MKMDYKTRVTPAKEEAVQALMDEFKEYDGFIFADYRGMTVEQITKLRKSLREKDAAFRVVKNRFAKIALSNMEMDSDEHLTGPTAIALAKGDGANLVAKDLFNSAKDGAPIKVKGALIDGHDESAGSEVGGHVARLCQREGWRRPRRSQRRITTVLVFTKYLLRL